jgi:hypothetical protein
MKKLFLFITILASFSLLFVQCNSEDDLVTDTAKAGGLIDVNTTAVAYVVGNNSSYTFNMLVYQNAEAPVTSVKISKYFKSVAVPWSDPSAQTTPDSIPSKTSNVLLQETINLTGTSPQRVTLTPLNYAALIDGLTVDGNPLPSNDGELRIGDAFNFIIQSVLADGRIITQSYEVGMKVSTRFAGKYKCIDALYYRIGVLTGTAADWPAETVIESVDAITYRVLEYWGLFDGNEWLFQIQADGTITYPVGQLFNGQPMITLESNPGDMVQVNILGTNRVIKDDTNGKDRLVMSIGYYTPGSGPRIMYQVLEKIVE